MLRNIIIVATAAVFVGSTAAAVAKTAVHHHSRAGYGYSYVPYYGYESWMADRHDPTDTNGF